MRKLRDAGHDHHREEIALSRNGEHQYRHQREQVLMIRFDVWSPARGEARGRALWPPSPMRVAAGLVKKMNSPEKRQLDGDQRESCLQDQPDQQQPDPIVSVTLAHAFG
jgi:hypothetical protein